MEIKDETTYTLTLNEREYSALQAALAVALDKTISFPEYNAKWQEMKHLMARS